MAPGRDDTDAGLEARAGGSLFADAGLTGVTVGVLALLSAINALSTSAYLPALPTVAADLGASTSSTQLTLTAYLLGIAVGQLTWGPLSDAVGRRRPLLVGLVCYIAASLLCAAAPSIGLLLVFRAVQGWAACSGQVLSRAVVADHASGTRLAQLITVLMLMGVIAPVAAPLIGSGLLLVGSWRTVFIFHAWVNAGIATGLGASMALVHRHLGRQARDGVSNPAGTARFGIVALLVGTCCTLAASLLDAPLAVWIVVLLLTVGSLAPIMGSTMSLALGESSHAIGTGTAVVGVLQALLGALAAPLVGLGGPEATLPMALTMVGAACVSGAAFLTARLVHSLPEVGRPRSGVGRLEGRD